MSSTTSLLKAIGSRIYGEENKKSFNLLYKGINNVDVEEFHVSCDAKGPTVTILYGKYNMLFGGYTSKDWSSSKMRYVEDEDAFLFYMKDCLTEECIFLPIKKDYVKRAITCDEKFGPTFGGGKVWDAYDLQVFKKDKKPEFEMQNGCMQLNGCLNVPCAYDVDDSLDMTQDIRNAIKTIKKKFEISALDETEKLEKVKVNSKDINSGTMLVKRIEVYQVVDDELLEPWITRPEDEDVSRMRRVITDMEPLPGLQISHYNILLIGLINSGKSSFVNTLCTAFCGKVNQYAPARNSSTSVTNEIKVYELHSDESKCLKIKIYDIRGFEDARGYDYELSLLLAGQLRIGYNFPDKESPVQKKDLVPHATLNDKIHLVCFVASISLIDTITKELRSRIDVIKNEIAKKGLPMIVVATKFDEMCPKIAADVDHIYKSPKAMKGAKKVARFFGTPLKHVFPVVNYVNEKEPNTGIDRLAILALHEMVSLIGAWAENHKDIVKPVDTWAEREKRLSVLRNRNDKEVQMMKLHSDISAHIGRTLRVLVIGPTNSGKSSFIDSTLSTLEDRMVNKVVGGRLASRKPKGVSSTGKFQMYQVKYSHESEELKKSSVYVGDTPGFQEVGGISAEQVQYILKGHVPNKYQISNGFEQNSPSFKLHPGLNDRIHVVCFVFDCKTLAVDLPDKYITTTKRVLDFVEADDIPFIVILTKCDVDNEAVQRGKCRVFANKHVKECKDKLMEIFQFKENTIFPVVNYVHESDVDLQGDALLLATFSQILTKGMDYLEDLDDNEEYNYLDETENRGRIPKSDVS